MAVQGSEVNGQTKRTVRSLEIGSLLSWDDMTWVAYLGGMNHVILPRQNKQPDPLLVFLSHPSQGHF